MPEPAGTAQPRSERSPAEELSRLQRDGVPVRWDAGCRLACRLVTLHSERALARALAGHLAQEVPDIEFALDDHLAVDLAWVCGYEPGHAALVRAVRERHPGAWILVTSRERLDLWREEVELAGADACLTWPIPFQRLSRIFHERRIDR